MRETTGSYETEEGIAVVSRFLEAIKNEDTLTFWRLIDRRSQGYFMGLWYYALGDSGLGAVSLLAENENFLQDALSSIVGELKLNLEELVNNPVFGAIRYPNELQALVPVTAGASQDGTGHTDHVPLVLELAAPENSAGDRFGVAGGMTCWRVDALKCFRVQMS